ncbi:uncharacterized protein EI90DRAFT_3290574 [Cantharellus anzutake]|uniref:uncharacterized protein n=1 Tax=Cantharellus anzutake TaxID=1750568 RepID=UPI0019082976|nr:uncharacterized protein EI90DRAFT_3290574 [Cantharellus anzutake]KAF8328402.1 hypothetical protein EI90DRAFT_3290574 [Cantharellus anzutake]
MNFARNAPTIKGVGGLGNTHTARVLNKFLELIREHGNAADISPYVRPRPSAYWGHHTYSKFRRTNAGKSTFISAIIDNLGGKIVRTGKRAEQRDQGVTRAFNFYPCGGPLIPPEKKVTLVDSPGYGDRGTEETGDFFQSYVKRRSNLKLILLLIDAELGMNHYDKSMLEFLSRTRQDCRPDVQIQPVLSKVDKASHSSVITRLGRTAEDVYRIAPNARQPFVLVGCKGHMKRLGIEEARLQILIGAGLASLRPKLAKVPVSSATPLLPVASAFGSGGIPEKKS